MLNVEFDFFIGTTRDLHLTVVVQELMENVGYEIVMEFI